MSTHTPIDVEFFALNGCSTQDCVHESDCPTITLTVCLDCNTTTQDGRPVEDWEGSAARCPIFGTGITPEQAEALVSALTVPQPSAQDNQNGAQTPAGVVTAGPATTAAAPAGQDHAIRTEDER